MTRGIRRPGGGGRGRHRSAVRGIDPSPSCSASGDWRHARRAAAFGLPLRGGLRRGGAGGEAQVAFFERKGSAGMAALEEVLAAARAAGCSPSPTPSGATSASTMAAYATAWLDPASPLAADAMTVVPTSALGALQPALDLAAAAGGAPSWSPAARTPRVGRSRSYGARRPTGPSVEDLLLADVAALQRRGLPGPGTVGAVVGATLDAVGVRPAGSGGVVLAPGFGAQGGTADTVRPAVRRVPAGHRPAQRSRSLLAADPTSPPCGRGRRPRGCAGRRRRPRPVARLKGASGPRPARLPVGGGQVLGEGRNGAGGRYSVGDVVRGRRTSRRRTRWTRRWSRRCRSGRPRAPRGTPVARRSTPARAAATCPAVTRADQAVDAPVGGGAHPPADHAVVGAVVDGVHGGVAVPAAARMRAGWPNRWTPPWARSFMAHSGLAGTVPSGSSSPGGWRPRAR